MVLLVPTRLTCPNCGDEFESIAQWTAHIAGMHTDFRVEHYGYDYSHFAGHTCPKCGFSGWKGWFTHRLSPRVRRSIKRYLRPLPGGQRGEDPWRIFEQAARIAKWRKLPPADIAYLHLFAAYLCARSTSIKRRKIERANRAQAAKFFVKALKATRVRKSSIPITTYLIGELYRRIGLRKKAGRWFKRAEMLAKSQKRFPSLVKLASQQRVKPQEMLPPFFEWSRFGRLLGR